MSRLPRIEKPTFPVTLLSRKKPVHITAYTVKESKILMMARESNDLDWYYNALKQVLNNCLVEKLDLDKLPLVDIEWLFLNLQARSVSEKLQLNFKCTNEVDKQPCGASIDIDVKILETPILNKEVNKTIMLADKVGMQMRLPTFETMKLLKASDNMMDVGLAALCIENIFDEKSVHKADETSPEELVLFVEGLPTDKFQQIAQFLAGCPVLRQTVEKSCPKCKYHHKLDLEGLDTFFG